MDDNKDVAIIGLAFKLPQGVEDVSSLWDTLESRKNLMTEWPDSRMNLDGFYDGNSRVNRLYSRGAHFISQDPGVFDAPFFSVTAKEAAAMDPMQRWTLETSYRAFENAGLPADALKGTQTAVFSASMSDDYTRMVAKDPETAPRMTITGSALSIIPNRVSWYFDLLGPSVHVDTACSSSMVALDMACQSLKNGDSTTALVTGANLILGPEGSVLLSNLNFVSPDSVCYSFDGRANGYARGEGIAAVVLKPLNDAVRDGDMIRAVIRGTASNQDGHTPGLTQPSTVAQEKLVRHVYQKVGLSFEATRYVEAHGTGTAVGDPIEMKALGRVFRSSRSTQDPLYVGSIKANIGHLEGSSGLGGILKSILILEKGVIPPNALFEAMNPAIDADFYNIAVPRECVPWPAPGLRRVSVNSFGFGGTNSHVILDDAYHYLLERQIEGNHCTAVSSESMGNGSGVVSQVGKTQEHSNGVRANGHTANRNLGEAEAQFNRHMSSANGDVKSHSNGVHKPSPKLLIFSALDERSLKRIQTQYQAFYTSKIHASDSKTSQLAYTLSSRRSHMLWRNFAITNDISEKLSAAKPVRTSAEAGIAFVFTGQGAQYVDMGVELLQYPRYRNAVKRVDEVYKELGCSWSIFDEISNEDHIDRPEYSQPLSTALQIALVELLKSFGVVPKAVIGHSSGEIAAAYAIGALTLESACKASYFRGQLAGKLRAAGSAPGAMISVNLPEDGMGAYLNTATLADVNVACINSPTNCTLSGPESSIDKLKVQLDKEEIFAQKLKTGVAYHSASMTIIAQDYAEIMGTLEASNPTGIPMISSVTGKTVRHRELATAQYWVDNMVSPVRFADAVSVLTHTTKLRVAMSSITDLVEVGSHCALKRPVQDTLKQGNRKKQIRYTSVLNRHKSATQATLELVGHLFCHGHDVFVSAANQDTERKFLADCPQYPFDNSHSYWTESRMSRDFRKRVGVKGETLGTRFHDWNPLEPRWRNFWSVESTPWVGDHVISDMTILPGAAMLVMAMEAVQQMMPTDRPARGFLIKEAHFMNPIIIKEGDEKTETALHLLPVQKSYEKESVWSDIKLFSYVDHIWTECFKASIQVQYEETSSHVDGGLERKLENLRVVEQLEAANEACKLTIDSSTFYQDSIDRGMRYDEWFQVLQDIRWDGKNTALVRIEKSPKHMTTSLVHPAILDGLFQALVPSATQGLTVAAAYVPFQLQDTWISANGWQSQPVNLHAILCNTKSNNREGSVSAVAEDGTVLCTMKRLIMSTVSRDDTEEVDQKRLLFGIDWKPQLSLLDSSELHKICNADTYVKDDSTMISYRNKMDSLMDTVLNMALKNMTLEDREKVPDFLQRHVVWMAHHVAHLAASGQTPDDMDDEAMETCLQELEVLHPPWKLFTEIARYVKPILFGQMDPLSVIFNTNLAEAFYADMFESTCDKRFETFLDLASHENPGLRILEVGAGTGGLTTHVLKTLQRIEKETGSLRFAEYTYTDISPTFFEPAREKWAHLSERMTFRTFDLERDPAPQGIEVSYDIVVAGSVLHATADLAATIRHVRKALKPGGRLVMLEPIAPQDVITNFGFGLVPGWWRCIEEWRSMCPAITEAEWDPFLKQCGFSGNDLVLRDYKSDRCHLLSVIVATAQEEVEATQEIVIVGERKINLSGQTVSSLEHLKDIDIGEKVVVVLEDKPFLHTISAECFEALKDLIRRTNKLLWVGFTDLQDQAYAHHSIMKGFLRSMRSEHIDKRIITLAIEFNGNVDYVSKVFHAAFEQRAPELEYIVQDGYLSVGRATEEIALDETMWSLVSPRLRNKSWSGPLELKVATPGMLDTLQFVEDKVGDLATEEVEIDSKAWGLSFRDVFVALGRLDDRDLGFDCAGVVTRVGSSCKEFQPGDRVCMISLGCMRTYPRAHQSTVAKIPETLSFAAAASIIGPGITAYYSLLEVARLKRGDKILIHSASGSTGQLAIWVAKMKGAEVFATVGFDEKKQLLIDDFGIPADHVFYSRNTSFAEGVMRVTKGYGVDVVLNSLSGDGLRASWECVAPFGRFIEIGKADITGNSSLPMSSFAKNVLFAAVDLHHVMETDNELTSQLLRGVMDLATKGEIQYPQPLHTYPVSELESAFRFLQSGRNTGRIVISVNPSDVVPQRVLEKKVWSLDSEATYVVAGGLGGIGRAIVRWMVSRGAKHLLLPSRSGAASKAASDLVEDLSAKGVNIMAPKCDVSSFDSLKEVLAGSMPPIKGCINAAMVLQDAIFDNMSHAQWELTIKSKVHSTSNLNELLPKDLDFFVLLSSLGGVYGNVAQSNYAAGCSFQDAVARHRTTHGQKAIAFDIGWMRNIGIIAETKSYEERRKTAADMQQIDDTELLALLSIYCDPGLPLPSPAKSQLFIGLITPSDFLVRGEDPPEITNRPLCAPFARIVGSADSASGYSVDASALFKQATESDGKAEIVIKALGAKLARAMSIAPDDIEPSKRLSHYGVDSLMAVELRNWMNKDFGANVAVFDIMGGTTISAIADLVVERSNVGM